MKNLPKVILIFLIALFSFQANAQTFGIKGGFNLASMLDEDEDGAYCDSYSSNPGFHAGVTLEFPLQNEALAFETGLIFSKKGMKCEDNYLGVEETGTYNLYYFDIPLTLKASSSFNDNAKIVGLFGPYIGIGIGGIIIYEASGFGAYDYEEYDIYWGNDEDADDLKRLELGLTFGAGIELNSSLFLGISYDLGMSNISAYQDYGTTMKNRVLKFSAGYKF